MKVVVLQLQSLEGLVQGKRTSRSSAKNDNAKPVPTQSMEHGIWYEPVAFREYQHYCEKLGCPVKVTQASFFCVTKNICIRLFT